MAAPPKPFFVLATVRSGSYNLVSLLNSAPDLVCYGEVYKEELVELPGPELAELGFSGDDTGRRDAMGRGFLDNLAGMNPGLSVGLKLLPAHIVSRPFLREQLFSGDFRVVILTRSALEICVSLKLAEQENAFTRKDEAQPTYQSPAVVSGEDIERTVGFLKRFKELARDVRQAPQVEHMNINYVQTHRPRAISRLLTFLGSTASAADLKSDYLRQSEGLLHDRVANWDEVVAYLNSANRARMLTHAGYDDGGKPLPA